MNMNSFSFEINPPLNLVEEAFNSSSSRYFYPEALPYIQDDANMLVIKNKQSILAALLYKISDKQLQITFIEKAPVAKGKQVASFLVDQLEEHFRGKIDAIFAHVRMDNAPSIAMFTRSGFAKDDTGRYIKYI